VIPEWYLYLKPDARISTKDLMQILGVKSDATIKNMVTRDLLPKPDSVKFYPRSIGSDMKKRKHFWLKSTIDGYLKIIRKNQDFLV
jgi:hypothetical protein